MAQSLSQVNGTVKNYGPGKGIALNFQCDGPACSDISGYPDISCTPTTDASGKAIHQCSNGVQGSGEPVSANDLTFLQQQPPPDQLGGITPLVSQQQDVITGPCGEGYSVSSDGTPAGVQVKDKAPSCSTSVAPVSISSTSVTAPIYSASSTTSAPPLFTDAAPKHHASRFAVLCSLLLGITLLIQGADAHDALPKERSLHRRVESGDYTTFKDNFVAYYKDVLCQPEETAKKFVTDLEYSACGQVISSGFSSLPHYVGMGDVMGSCVKTLYGYNLTSPGKELGSVLYSTLLCNYATNVIFEPSDGELTYDYCYTLLNPPASTLVESFTTTVVETLSPLTYTTTVETTDVLITTVTGPTTTETSETTSVYTTEVIVTQEASTITDTVVISYPYTVYKNVTQIIPYTSVVSIPVTTTLPGTTVTSYIYKTFVETVTKTIKGPTKYVPTYITETTTDVYISKETVPSPYTKTEKYTDVYVSKYTDVVVSGYPVYKTDTKKVTYPTTVYVTVTSTEYKKDYITTTCTLWKTEVITTCAYKKPSLPPPQSYPPETYPPESSKSADRGRLWGSGGPDAITTYSAA